MIIWGLTIEFGLGICLVQKEKKIFIWNEIFTKSSVTKNDDKELKGDQSQIRINW